MGVFILVTSARWGSKRPLRFFKSNLWCLLNSQVNYQDIASIFILVFFITCFYWRRYLRTGTGTGTGYLKFVYTNFTITEITEFPAILFHIYIRQLNLRWQSLFKLLLSSFLSLLFLFFPIFDRVSRPSCGARLAKCSSFTYFLHSFLGNIHLVCKQNFPKN